MMAERQVLNPPPIHSKSIVWNNRISPPWQRWFASVHEVHKQHFPTFATVAAQPAKPVFVMPSYSTSERDSLKMPINGMQIYNTTTHEINWYRNGAWSNTPS